MPYPKPGFWATTHVLAVKVGVAEDRNATRPVGPRASSDGANLGDAPPPPLGTSVSHLAAGAVTSPGVHNEVVADRHGPPMTVPEAMADASSRFACERCWLILAVEQRLRFYQGSMWCLGPAEPSSSRQHASHSLRRYRLTRSTCDVGLAFCLASMRAVRNRSSATQMHDDDVETSPL